MERSSGSTGDLSQPLGLCLEKAMALNETLLAALLDQAKAAQTYTLGLLRSINDFLAPSLVAFNSLATLEMNQPEPRPSPEGFQDWLALYQLNLKMLEKGLQGGLKSLNDYQVRQMDQAFQAWLQTAADLQGQYLADFMARQAQIMDLVVHDYPRAIREIQAEYGFHFDDGGYILVAETERFYLYQVLPRDKAVKVRPQGKPLLLLPPYVLGSNIMAFLPGENKSFVHCFANQGIPTYIRIVKDIQTNLAVQLLTGEEDCLDTRFFLEKIKERHGQAATLCGYCQGGFTAVVNLLSGELDGLVDALITCVAPMDGTRSRGLRGFLDQIPQRFRDMSLAIKTLPNGNRVVDGRLLSWVFKLRNIALENPVSAFYRDLQLLEKGGGISKSAAAINYWLLYDITDLPLAVCKMSYDSYNIPVTADGTLPVTLFGRFLNFKGIKERGIPWLICCADRDDLVEKECALAPLDWVEAEVSIFPKGHVAIATSWSLPTSECSLDSCFLDYRGPVRFQLDLEAAQQAPRPAPRPRPRAKKPGPKPTARRKGK